MEGNTHLLEWKVGRVGTPSSVHSTCWSDLSYTYTHIIFFQPPCLGGEGEGDHCEVEGGGDVDVPRPLLWERVTTFVRFIDGGTPRDGVNETWETNHS